MAHLMLGKEVNASIRERVHEKVRLAAGLGTVPCLEIIRVGEKESDLAYERNAVRRCESLGIRVRKEIFPENASGEDVARALVSADRNEKIHGVLLLRPLPHGLDMQRIANLLSPKKDVDGMTDLSMSGVYQGKDLGYPPCTAQAVMEMLDYYQVDPRGRRAVVIGRSAVIGRPVSMMLMRRDATVTICHTKTRNLEEIAKEADILVSAAGHACTVTGSCVREGQVIVDVGINTAADGELCGDAVFEEAEPVVSMITPVPGGVGSVTTAVLALHTADAAVKAGQALHNAGGVINL